MSRKYPFRVAGSQRWEYLSTFSAAVALADRLGGEIDERAGGGDGGPIEWVRVSRCEWAARLPVVSRPVVVPQFRAAARFGPERLAGDDLIAFVRGGDVHVSLVEVSYRLGVHHRQVHRWRARGVCVPSAEDVADRLGVHPTEIWGVGWWSAVDAMPVADDDDLWEAA